MDELTLNRVASQLGAALINNLILQGQTETLNAEKTRLQAQLTEVQAELAALKAQLGPDRAEPA